MNHDPYSPDASTYRPLKERKSIWRILLATVFYMLGGFAILIAVSVVPVSMIAVARGLKGLTQWQIIVGIPMWIGGGLFWLWTGLSILRRNYPRAIIAAMTGFAILAIHRMFVR